MTNNDYRQGYKDGFADGYKKAKEDAGLPFYPPVIPSSPPPLSGGCSICKREGVWSIVCYHPQCPTRITATYLNNSYTGTTGTTGAVGSYYNNDTPKGSNGPAGY